jgi:hypothetical protein
MPKYIVQVDLSVKYFFNGFFQCESLDEAVSKVNNNVDVECNAKDAQLGLDTYGAAHYFDRFGCGYCVIRKGDI